MEMVKRGLICLAVILISLQFVLATDTEITIKTVPGYKVSISMLKTDSVYYLIDSAHITANNDGEVKKVFSTSEDKFKLNVLVRKDGVKVASKSFDDEFVAGTPITLEVYPDWYTPSVPAVNSTNSTSIVAINNSKVNETTTNKNLTSSANELTSKSSDSVTGFSISDMNILSKTNVLIFVGVIVLIIIIVFLLKMIKKRDYFSDETPKEEFKTRKMSELIRERDKSLLEMQRKLRETQDELNRVKNQEKIKEIERKIDEDKKELSRLKRGS